MVRIRSSSRKRSVLRMIPSMRWSLPISGCVSPNRLPRWRRCECVHLIATMAPLYRSNGALPIRRKRFHLHSLTRSAPAAISHGLQALLPKTIEAARSDVSQVQRSRSASSDSLREVCQSTEFGIVVVRYLRPLIGESSGEED